METATTGIELKLADGAVIKAATAEEALKIAAKMYEDTKNYAKDEKAQREAMEARIASIEARAAEASKPKLQAGQFDNERYFKLLNEDPVSAANYLDAHRFGVQDPSQVPGMFQGMQTDLSVMKQEAMAAKFMQQHAKDFPQNAESARELRTTFESYLNAGYPATVETLNLAYSNAINEGRIKPMEEKAEEEPVTPNPSLSGSGSSADAAEINKVEQMSDADLEKYLKEKGLL